MCHVELARFAGASECETLSHLVTNAQATRSQVLVLRGEAGIGRTALLQFLLESAADCRVSRAAGVESEMELAFASLHQLCAPFLDRLDQLPARSMTRPPPRSVFGQVTRPTASSSAWPC